MTAETAALPRLVDLDDASFDPAAFDRFAIGDTDDPYPVIHALAAEGAVRPGNLRDAFTDRPDALSKFEHYMVFGYDNVAAVFTDPETFTNGDVFMHSIGRAFGRTLSVLDGDEHQRYRRIFQKAFLPNVVAEWAKNVVGPVVDGLISKFAGRGRADLIGEFTRHYPFQVIYSQLGLSPEQAPVFHKLAVAQGLATPGLPEGMEACRKTGDFFQALIDLRRLQPADDLITHLATVEVDGERLPDAVLVGFMRQLLSAGADTTYRGTSALMVGLLTNPDQLAAVTADRSLVAAAIEEALRWESPLTATWRYVAKDAELAGVHIPKGVVVDVVIGSANRDPAKFEHPDRFDIFRDRSTRHFAFASGPHICIGQHLAKLEMTRAVNALLDRLPNLRLDPDAAPPGMRGFRLRVAERLDVVFDPEDAG